MEPSARSSHSNPPPRKERVDKTFWDTDFFQDSKIQEIEARFNDAAPAYYELIVFQILREGGSIRWQGAIAILRKKQIADQAEAFLTACVEIGLFFRDGEFIGSHRADKEIENLSAKRDTWRTRQNKKRVNTETNKSISQVSRVTHAVVTRDSEEEEEHEHEEEKEVDQEKEQEREAGGPSRHRKPEIPKRIEPPDPSSKPDDIDPNDWKQAVERLPQPTDPPSEWQKSNQWVCAGRRPMLKYPDLWITAPELANAIRIFKNKSLPIKHWRGIFETAQANAATKRTNGVNPERYGAFNAITGWILGEALKQLNDEVKINRNRGGEDGVHTAD